MCESRKNIPGSRLNPLPRVYPFGSKDLYLLMWSGTHLSLRTTALMLLRYHRNVCDAGYCRVSGRGRAAPRHSPAGAPPASGHAHAARPPSPARPARRVRVLILSVGSSRGGAGGIQCDTDILGALRINTYGTDSSLD